MNYKKKVKKKMSEKLLDIIDDLGWCVRRVGDDYYEIGQSSPAGEDFWFPINQRHAVADIIAYAEDFDAEAHAVMWANAKAGGATDIPALRIVVDDAEAIQEMLLELARAVSLSNEEGEL